MMTDRRQLRCSPGTQRLYAAQDADWNVTALIGTDGYVKERFQYTPYGQRTVLSPNWTAATDAYAFLYAHQGGRAASATGLIHFQARDYNPALGTWMQQDPLGYVDGMNRYQMEGSSPINRYDPAGLSFSFSPPKLNFGPGNNVSFSSSLEWDVLGFDLFDASWKGSVSWGASPANLPASQCKNGGLQWPAWSIHTTVSAYPVGAAAVLSGGTKNVQGGAAVGIDFDVWSIREYGGFFLDVEWYSWNPKCGCTKLYASGHFHGSETIGFGSGLEVAFKSMPAVAAEAADLVGTGMYYLVQVMRSIPKMPVPIP